MKIKGDMSFIENLRSIVPTEVYTALKTSYGGFSFKLFEVLNFLVKLF